MARLKLLKGSYQSQQYKLEDDLLKRFPEEIERTRGFITGFKADMGTLAAHPHPKDGFAGMTLRGDTLTDKDNAGAALLAACKDIKGIEPVEIGSYRGFTMLLSMEGFGQEYVLTLKGQMSHRATLGKDVRGNLVRMDNALSGMDRRLEAAEASLQNLQMQVESAREELGKPFPQETELREKSARLAELNAELNIDSGAPSIQEEAQTAKRERSSVLSRLNTPRPERAAASPKRQIERTER